MTQRASPTDMHKLGLTLLVIWALVLQAVLGTAGLAASPDRAIPAASDICRAGDLPDSSGWPAAPSHHPDDPCCSLACLTKGMAGSVLLPRIVAVALLLAWDVVATPVPAGRTVTRPLGPPPRPLGSRAPPPSPV